MADERNPTRRSRSGSGGGHRHWEVSNQRIRARLAVDAQGFRLVSLYDRVRRREWSAEASDEFRLDVMDASGGAVTLTGASGWSVDAKEAPGQQHIAIRLDSPETGIRVVRHYECPGDLPVIRQWMTVGNRGDSRLYIRRANALRLRIRAGVEPLTLRWMNNYCRGMKPSPSHPIHTRSLVENAEQTLATGPYSPDCAWFCLESARPRGGIVGGWEWSGPMAVRVAYDAGACLIEGGVDADGLAEPLPPDGVYTSPVFWCGFHDGDASSAGAACHAVVRHVIGPPLPHAELSPLVYCSWAYSLDAEESPFFEQGSHPWFPSQANVLSQVAVAAEMGFEVFTLDYGWFPRVGDWWCDAERFPDGPKGISEAVHRAGMKLGIWLGFGNADQGSQVVRDHPEWLATYRGKPIPDDFFIRTGASVWGTRILCLGHRPAREWVKEQIRRVFDAFEVDWFKHDFDPVTICQSAEHTHAHGDSRVAACEGFYEIMDFVREHYPSVVCENWANDSGLPDYGMIRRHHAHLIGDAYGALLLRQMFYGISHVFPPEMLYRYLRFEDSEGDLRFMFRSGALGGPIAILSDLRVLSAEQRTALQEEMALFRQTRHLARRGTLFRLLGRPHPSAWDATELWDDDAGEGVVYVFRNRHARDSHRVPLQGLDMAAIYEVTQVDSGGTCRSSGRDLVRTGVTVVRPEMNSSEVLRVHRVGGAP